MERRNGRIAMMALLCAALAAGCSARTGGGGSERSGTNVITTAEMDEAGHADAYSLVQALRPRWLRIRGTSSIAVPETIKVYLDGSLLGGTDHLRQISTHSIASLRYMDGLEATQRWGLDHGAGAIIVSTRGRTNEGSGCCD